MQAHNGTTHDLLHWVACRQQAGGAVHALVLLPCPGTVMDSSWSSLLKAATSSHTATVEAKSCSDTQVCDTWQRSG
jgi:hypothetical protein